MTKRIECAWTGWSGDTVVKLTDGSVWQQQEYWYSYHYAYRPEVTIANGRMLVAGMAKAIRVRRLV